MFWSFWLNTLKCKSRYGNTTHWTVVPLGRSGERGWTSLARRWWHCSLPDGKAQMLWGVKWSGKERNGIAKEAALTLKASKCDALCRSSSQGTGNQCCPTYFLPEVWFPVPECGPQVQQSGGWDWPEAGSDTRCPVRQRVPPLWVSTQGGDFASWVSRRCKI